MKYKVAIIGCGRIAERHAKVISESEDLHFYGVCDITMPKAIKLSKALSNFYKNDYPNTYSDYNKMLDIGYDGYQIITVCTEAGNHAKVVCDIAKYGKPIIVEKPMALTIEDADKMIVACAKHNVKLFVVKQNRYNLPVMALKEAIDKGRFGKLTLGTIRLRWHRDMNYFNMDDWRGTWALDGGVLASQASHHVDLLQWMMGPVKSVMAMTTTRQLDIEVDDTGAVLLEFESGALGIIEATNAAQPENLEGSISILGEGGTVIIGGIAVNRLDMWRFIEKDPMDDNIGDMTENPPDVYGYGHRRFYEAVVKCLDGKESNVIDGYEGRKSLELINAIYESAETGKRVYLKFQPEHVRLGK